MLYLFRPTYVYMSDKGFIFQARVSAPDSRLFRSGFGLGLTSRYGKSSRSCSIFASVRLAHSMQNTFFMPRHAVNRVSMPLSVMAWLYPTFNSFNRVELNWPSAVRVASVSLRKKQQVRVTNPLQRWAMRISDSSLTFAQEETSSSLPYIYI